MSVVIDGTLGITTPAETITTNLTFTGTGNRITGDFSNATVANQASFQTSTENTTTIVSAIPNGTGMQAAFRAYNNSDPTNASIAQIIANASSDVRFVSSITGTGTYLPMTFLTGGSERARIDTSGNVGIGVTPSAWNEAGWKTLQVNYGSLTGNASSFVELGANEYWNGTNFIYIGTANASKYRQNAGVHSWYTAPSGTAGDAITFTQAMTLDTSGSLLVGATSLYSGAERLLVSSGSNDWNSVFRSTTVTAAQAYGIVVDYTSAPNGTTNWFYRATDGNFAAVRYEVRSNGGIANYSANNVNLSDERVKKDIVNAGSYLDKICAIPVRTFLYKDQTDTQLNLGCIAQEVEAVAPELVDVGGFGETPEDGIPLKAIYQTDLQYALMKCIQEQQALITQLQADVAALKALSA